MIGITGKIGIISDIHSNLEAFEAVLQALKEQDVERILCLGDVVGYGANPNGCIELIMQEEIPCIMGNHDAAALGLMDLNWFNPYARAVAEWTAHSLLERSKSFLQNLKERMIVDEMLLVHGSPYEPLLEYVTSLDAVIQCFHVASERIILVGHTHVAHTYTLLSEDVVSMGHVHGGTVDISAHRHVLNPGAVGQPRDYNPHASYAVIDNEWFTVYRVTYDVHKAAGKIMDAGLPEILSTRLLAGT